MVEANGVEGLEKECPDSPKKGRARALYAVSTSEYIYFSAIAYEFLNSPAR